MSTLLIPFLFFKIFEYSRLRLCHPRVITFWCNFFCFKIKKGTLLNNIKNKVEISRTNVDFLNTRRHNSFTCEQTDYEFEPLNKEKKKLISQREPS